MVTVRRAWILLGAGVIFWSGLPRVLMSGICSGRPPSSCRA